jgi:hypothetical protein
LATIASRVKKPADPLKSEQLLRAKYVDDASLQDGNTKPVVVDFWSVRGVL